MPVLNVRRLKIHLAPKPNHSRLDLTYSFLAIFNTSDSLVSYILLHFFTNSGIPYFTFFLSFLPGAFSMVIVP